MSTTTNYLINLYRSLIIKRDELKKQVEENQKIIIKCMLIHIKNILV